MVKWHVITQRLLQVDRDMPLNLNNKKVVMKLAFSCMLFAAIGLGFVAPASAAGNRDTKADYTAAKNNASTQYKINRAKCDALMGNPKEVCVMQAKSDQLHAEAEAEVAYKGTDKARSIARKDIANADYDVAKTQCKSRTGNDEDVCIQEAKSARIAALVDAKADLKVAGIRKEAAEDKMDAEYKVAKEKCDGLAGEAKDGCLKLVKAHFSK